ncbi:MAG: transposase [Halanaerobium sp.]
MICLKRTGRTVIFEFTISSSTWQDIYDKRTSVERTFSRLKEHLNLENLTVMGAEKVMTHVLLSCISLIASKISVEKQKSREIHSAA